jgi:Flp pilus assembly protein TadD
MICANNNVPAQSCPPQSAVTAALTGDARARTLVQSLQLEGSDPEQAIALRRGIDRTGLPNDYVLDIFLANTLSANGQVSEALPHFASAIRGNPYAAAFYDDLGDAMRSQFEFFLAWVCYDLARALPGSEYAQTLQNVGEREEMLRTEYPQFF